MIRLSKMADYGIVLLAHLAQSGATTRTARSLAEESGLPLPTTSKLLKRLSRAGVLTAQRGHRGGYVLSQAPRELTVAAMVRALDGPITMTECSDPHCTCELEPTCRVRAPWEKINLAVTHTLTHLTLQDLAGPPQLVEIGRQP
jgi:FeS assembly SUF system regulator